MIEYRKGNLLDVTRGVIIHGCNSHGVMGSGVALAVKNKYPGCFETYHLYCERRNNNQTILGDSIVYVASFELTIVNMITQKDYGAHRRQVNYGAIAKGFSDLHNNYYIRDQEFHFPKIGAGLGGGDWEVISEIIEYVCSGRKLICWEL
jgi:O-acetyl-ADP-ribose deacetylase (regulator of RNase III)